MKLTNLKIAPELGILLGVTLLAFAPPAPSVT